MKTELNKLSDVPTALDLVKGEVLRAQKAILDEAKKWMDPAHMEDAKQAITYAQRLEAFVEKVDTLGLEWESLSDKAEQASPETKEIVRRAGVDARKSPDPKTNLEVTFPDGTVVHEAKANLTMGKVVELIGPDKVAALTGSVHFRPNGEPLVTHVRSDLIKYPSNILKLKGGWYLNTQTDTERKAETIKAISKALKLNLKVIIVPGTYLSGVPTLQPSPQPPNASLPDKAGKEVHAVSPSLQKDQRVHSSTEAGCSLVSKPINHAALAVISAPNAALESLKTQELLTELKRRGLRASRRDPLAMVPAGKTMPSCNWYPRAVALAVLKCHDAGINQNDALAAYDSTREPVAPLPATSQKRDKP